LRPKPTGHLQALAHGVGGRSGEDRHREEPRADDAEREHQERKVTRDWAKSLSDLGGGIDVRESLRGEGSPGGKDDGDSDHVGESHADQRIGADTFEGLPLLGWCPGEWFLESINPLVLRLLRGCQKKR